MYKKGIRKEGKLLVCDHDGEWVELLEAARRYQKESINYKNNEYLYF
ncbi:hypothetical protein [Paenibacillus sp. Marseille-Q4541]|nr:hypothetical protein [Paenibacillus sp. Marseille-Q4541]